MRPGDGAWGGSEAKGEPIYREIKEALGMLCAKGKPGWQAAGRLLCMQVMAAAEQQRLQIGHPWGRIGVVFP